MITLDLPPQIEMQIIEIAKQQNMSIDDYILLATQEKLAQDKQQDNPLENMYEALGFRPLATSPNAKTVTNEYINELREKYGI